MSFRRIDRRPSHAELRAAYGSIRSVARKFGIHPTTARYWLLEAGVVLKTPGQPAGARA